jgi:hypothetical protein
MRRVVPPIGRLSSPISEVSSETLSQACGSASTCTGCGLTIRSSGLTTFGGSGGDDCGGKKICGIAGVAALSIFMIGDSIEGIALSDRAYGVDLAEGYELGLYSDNAGEIVQVGGVRSISCG